MLHNRFHPLYAAAETAPPANPGTAAPTTPEPAPEKEGEKNEPEPTPEPEQEPEPAPSTDAPAPAETVAPTGKLNAFQRGALRALSMGDLISRVERAESAELVAKDEVTRLTADNLRLNQRDAETPAKIAAAQKVHEKDVSNGVRAELGKIGVSAEVAPSQISADDADKTLSRAEFEKFDHAARNAFMRQGGKLTA